MHAYFAIFMSSVECMWPLSMYTRCVMVTGETSILTDLTQLTLLLVGSCIQPCTNLWMYFQIHEKMCSVCYYCIIDANVFSMSHHKITLKRKCYFDDIFFIT